MPDVVLSATLTSIIPSSSSLNFFFIHLLIYLLLAAPGLCCCPRVFSGCGEWGLLYFGGQASHCGGVSGCRVQVPGPRGFSSCGAWA